MKKPLGLSIYFPETDCISAAYLHTTQRCKAGKNTSPAEIKDRKSAAVMRQFDLNVAEYLSYLKRE